MAIAQTLHGRWHIPTEQKADHATHAHKEVCACEAAERRSLCSNARLTYRMNDIDGRTSEYSRAASSTRPRWKALLPACRSLALLEL